MLGAIEKATGNTLDKMELPTVEEVTDKRVGKFKQRITETLDTEDLEIFRKLVQDYQHEYGVPVVEIAAALGMLAQGKKPLQDKVKAAPKHEKKSAASEPGRSASGKSRRDKGKDNDRKPADTTRAKEAIAKPERKTQAEKDRLDSGMERFRIEVGNTHGVKPGNIVGAIANEAEIDSEHIGRIEIFADYSTVDLPEGMPKELMKHLKTVWISGQRLQISRLNSPEKSSPGAAGKRKPASGKSRASRPQVRLEGEEKPDSGSRTPSRDRRPAK